MAKKISQSNWGERLKTKSVSEWYGILGVECNGEINIRQGEEGSEGAGVTTLNKGVRGCMLNFGRRCSDLTSGLKNMFPQLLKRTTSSTVLTLSWEDLHPTTDLCKSINAYASSVCSEQIG